MPSDTVEWIGLSKIVPVLTAVDADEAEQACRALLAGGVSVVEITFRTSAAVEAIRRAASIEGLLVGAGTVLTVEQLGAAVDAGARFAVAPGTNREVVDTAHGLGVTFVPGAATPSEVEQARGLGCEVVKVFPAATVGGPGFLRAVAAVYPGVRFLPTGGIGPDNLASYLEVPSVVAVAGTWVCDRALLGAGRFDEVERRARAAVEAAEATVAA